MSNTSIWPIDRTLSSATTLGCSRLGSYGNEKVLLLYSHVQIHNDTIIKTDAGRLLYKYMYLSLYCKGSKRVTQGLCERELETEQ